jgi:molecular chaperone GrpE (heat shock protein)
MLPVIDAFRNATKMAPPSTEREENMHKNFGSLLSSILNVFQKYGYKEFTAGSNRYIQIVYVSIVILFFETFKS